MADGTVPEGLEALEPLIGQWRMSVGFTTSADDAPRALTIFEWLRGKRFLIQRWEVDHRDAPDGIAVIGFDPTKVMYRQHYFDSRGVERVYDMTLADGVWTLQRLAADPDFSQRFAGHFSDDGNVIVGHWEISRDGSGWSPDFDLTYARVRF